MAYKYLAYTPKKKVIKGKLDVLTEDGAAATLERAGLRILSLRKARNWNIWALVSSLSGVKNRDVILFSRRLAMMLERGTGFLAALQISQDQTDSKALKRILTAIINDIRSGSTFSAAVAKHPQVFPISYSRMMKVGEETGNMESVLREMASNMERNEATKKKIKAALTYPAFILILGLVAAVILVTAVLPTLTRLFTQFDAQLPLTTRMLMAFIDFTSSYISYIFSIGFLLILLTVWYIRRPSGRYRFEKLLLRLPVIGRLSLLYNMCNFSRIMSMLLRAGLSITEVITIARQSVGSEVTRRALGDIPKNLFQGQGLSQAMKADRIFPNLLLQIVTTGEETNTLDSSFAAVAEHYEAEFEDASARLTSLLEPLMMLLIGLAVGYIAISLIMPIYSVYNAIG